tara:strand:- start:276 stop:629 length:354 start_codon:yes stop_codon:yes gene_type:complete
LAVIITKILIGGILKSINAHELKKLINEKSNFTLLDVREDSELKIAKIKISKHIPMGEISTRIEEIDIETPIIVMCHSGVRSARVCQYLTENGYDASNLTGGINSWSTDVDPSVPIY